MLSTDNGFQYVIDSGPDFRQQMLTHQVKELHGILFTHEHKDHIAGLDDVRAFNHKKNNEPMDIFCSSQVEKAIKREFHYVFSNETYPGIPKLNLINIKNESFFLNKNLSCLPILVYHYQMPVFGFRIKDFTYITDAKTIDKKEYEKINGSKVLIINCLHEKAHISHFNLEEVLEFIKKIEVEIVYLTHISHYFGKHQDIIKKLPKNVFPAYDGLQFSV